MAFLKVYTPEQLYEFMKAKVLADNVGLTNFNKGSRTRTLLEAVSDTASIIGFDFLAALRRAIPVAFYDAFDFKRKDAVASSGYIRFYRLPEMTITYSGAGTNCLMSITAVNFTTTCSGAPGDNLNIALAGFPTTAALQAQINAQPNYSCTLVGAGTAASNTLYNYVNVDVVAARDYLYTASSRDILIGPAAAVPIAANINFQVDDLEFWTTIAGNILAGDASSDQIASECLSTGPEGNLVVNGLDTRNGKGSVLGMPVNTDYAVNDSAFSGGINEETDDERKERFTITVEGLAGSTVRGLEAATLAIDGVRSVTIRERYPVAGENTVIADDGTGNLSPAKQQEILDKLNGDPTDFVNFPGYRAAGIIINVAAPVIVPVNVAITIYRVGIASDATEIENTVQTIIEQYINTRKLGEDPILTELIRRVKQGHPAIVDLAITNPLVNPSINTSSLARTGAGTGAAVTVTLVTWGAYP